MKLLKKIDKTCDVAWKKCSGQSKSAQTEENIEEVEEMNLNQEDHPGTRSTPAEIAWELNIDCWSVSCIIDEDLDLCQSKWESVFWSVTCFVYWIKKKNSLVPL